MVDYRFANLLLPESNSHNDMISSSRYYETNLQNSQCILLNFMIQTVNKTFQIVITPHYWGVSRFYRTSGHLPIFELSSRIMIGWLKNTGIFFSLRVLIGTWFIMKIVNLYIRSILDTKIVLLLYSRIWIETK